MLKKNAYEAHGKTEHFTFELYLLDHVVEDARTFGSPIMLWSPWFEELNVHI